MLNLCVIPICSYCWKYNYCLFRACFNIYLSACFHFYLDLTKGTRKGQDLHFHGKKNTISPFLCFLVDNRVHDSAHSVTDCQVTRPFNSAPLCSLPSQVVVTHGPSRTDVRRSSVTLSRSLRYPLYPCLKKKVPFFRQRR